ncbi:U3 snoRNP protein [Emydomyces testavorans]|uniref:U3 small nucleolar RNA-associated protein 22 n=1 Tax=Emydomyces testavorans TaxID=2070801 RepID=A0AAF0IL34_9EURO|nr:U3 snoRNP protein [Emydomyces testavorans]
MSFPSAKRRKLALADEKHNGEKPDNREDHGSGVFGRNDSRGARSQSIASTVELATASGQFKSNLFKLQVDELLSQLRSDQNKQLGAVEQHLRRLKNIIENIPDIPPKPIRDAEKDLRRKAEVVIPFPEPRPSSDVKYTLQYARPANINVVGSFALKTAVKGLETSMIDLAVTIPGGLLQKKDYLDYRYFHKRAYYIACIAAGIKASKDSVFDLKYAYQDDDKLRPVLLIKVIDGINSGHSHLRVRVLTAVKDDMFPVHQTLPTSQNVRRILPAHEAPETSPGLLEFTSFYNSTLRAESSVTAYLKLLHGATIKCPAFRDACILGRTWLRQRGFGTAVGRGGFGHFEWAVITALLLETGAGNGKPLFSITYNAYQIFKAMIQFLGGRDLTMPYVLFSAELAHKIHPSNHPILFDGKQGINLLYKMTIWSYQLLRHESIMTLKMLNDVRFDHFDNIFINRIDYPLCRFDESVTFKPRSWQPTALDALLYSRSVYDVFMKALGDRAKLVHITCCDSSQWSITSSVNETAAAVVSVGLLINPDNGHRIVDHGPLADDKEAALAFRSFWGDKAELRRFKDGTIAESLVWSDRQSDGSIIHQILTYILRRHFDLERNAISFTGLDLHEKFPAISDSIKPTALFQPVLDAFNSLSSKLRRIDGLPLTFRQLYAASPALRYSSLHLPVGARGRLQPADVILQFESSSRWPDDLTAIQVTKLSFLVKIGELLESSEGGVSCRVGLEDNTGRLQNAAYLDIDFSSMVTFRLRIYHEREQVLLERRLKDRDLGTREKEHLASSLIAYKRTFTQQLQHTRAIQTLATRYPLLSPTVRVFKLWINSHLLAPHFCEELLELLVCHVFLYPYPWSAPSSVTSGLLHTLHFLSRWDWEREPLVLDFNNELTSHDLADIKTRFVAWRKIDPLMNTISLFVASNLDRDGATWTQQARPPKVVALRISSLAKAAMDLVKEKGVDLRFSDLFRTPLRDYDFLFHLKPKNHAGSKSQSIYKNLQDPEMCREASRSEFIAELNRLYGSQILFFHGTEERTVIAGLWKPHFTKPRPFGLKLKYSMTPMTGPNTKEEEVTLGKFATLNVIACLGGDIIREVEINR